MYIESRLYNMEKLKQNRKWISLGVLGLLVITLGVSFAYWIITLSQTGVNEIASSCFSITLTNEQNAINLQKAYPILDEEGKKFRIVQDRKEVKKALILYKESAFSRLKRRIKMFFYDLKFK